MRTRAWPSVAAVAAMVASMLVLWPAARPVSAAPGDLDPTFAGTGQAVTDVSGQFSEADAVAVQPDGKIVTVGTTAPGRPRPAGDPASDIAVMRYNPDGTPDASFGKGGVVTTDLYGDADEGHAVALQADGKIVVVGTTAGRTPGRDIAVLRYDPAGALDPDFGAGGQVTTDLGGDDQAFAVALWQQDGDDEQRIVVGGIGVETFAVLRYGGGGGLDTTFGDGGIVLTGGYGGARVTALLVQPDDKILAVGPSFGQFAMFRLEGDGQLEYSFGDYGHVSTDLGGDDEPLAVVLSAEERIYVAGRSDGDIAVARYDAFGFLDDSFAGGYVRTSLGEGTATASAAVALGDGSDEGIVVAGETASDVVLLQYEYDGEQSEDFGDGGVVITDVAGGSDEATAMVPLPGGQLLVAGGAETALGPDAAVLRYHADGAADELFGTAGHTTTDIPSPGDELTAVGVDGSENVVAAGYSATGLGWDFAVSRLSPYGFPDYSFGVEGRVTTDLGGNDRAHAMALTETKITVAGETDREGVSEFAVARYRSFGDGTDGILDPFFGEDGFVTTGIGEEPAGARAVTVHNEQVIAVGYASNDFAVVRYGSNGTLDSSFGEGGVVVTSIFGGFAQAKAVAVQDDGKIVVVGDYFDGGGVSFGPSFFGSGIRPSSRAASARAARGAQYDGDHDLVIVRYLDTGELDPDFGSDGVVTIDVDNGHDEARAMALQPDGKIIVAGRVFPGSGEIDTESEIGATGRIGMIRYDPAAGTGGGLDAGFGDSGRVVTDLAGDRDGARAITFNPFIGITVAGLTSVGGTADFAVLRYDTAGSLDGGFGDGGVTATDFGGGQDEARALAMLPTGSVIVAGSTRHGSRTAFAMARYDDDGRQDPVFGLDGTATVEVAGDLDEARAVAVQPDGRVVVAGESRSGPAGDFAVLRYDPDGTLDESFGRGGRVVTDLSGVSDGAYAVALQPDGKIVAAGVAGRGPFGDFAFVRYLPDGTLDGEFGDGGITTVDIAGGTSDVARGLALQPNGALVAAGSTFFDGDDEFPAFEDFALVRLTSTGLPDPEFNDGTGEVTTDFDGGADRAYAVALQADGKIVAAGVTDDFGAVRPALARYNPDGGRDDTFGVDGLVDTDVGGQGTASALAIQPDGKLLIAGDINEGEGGRRNIAMRYGVNGAVDTSFGTSGIATADLGRYSRATAVAIQPDGGIAVAADYSDEVSSELALIRYRPDGVPDPRFGEDGVARSGVAGFGDESAGIALQPDGQLVAVGPALFDRDADFTVLRFLGGETGPVGPPAELTIGMVASADTVRLDEPLRYVITVSNAGPGPATAVLVTDELPAGVTLLSTTAGQGGPCAVDGTALSCPLGSIAVGASVGLTITVQPTEVGTLTNTASVRSDQQDTDPSDDTASVLTSVLPLSSIRVNPGVVPLGRVVLVIGSGFTPDAPVSVGLAGLPAVRTVTPGADGSFSTPLVVFAETTPGSRVVEVRSVSNPAEVLATTNLLVVSDTLTPPNFVGRN